MAKKTSSAMPLDDIRAKWATDGEWEPGRAYIMTFQANPKEGIYYRLESCIHDSLPEVKAMFKTIRDSLAVPESAGEFMLGFFYPHEGGASLRHRLNITGEGFRQLMGSEPPHIATTLARALARKGTA